MNTGPASQCSEMNPVWLLFCLHSKGNTLKPFPILQVRLGNFEEYTITLVPGSIPSGILHRAFLVSDGMNWNLEHGNRLDQVFYKIRCALCLSAPCWPQAERVRTKLTGAHEAVEWQSTTVLNSDPTLSLHIRKKRGPGKWRTFPKAYNCWGQRQSQDL